MTYSAVFPKHPVSTYLVYLILAFLSVKASIGLNEDEDIVLNQHS